MTDQEAPRSTDTPSAVAQTSRWPGWIWAVPIAALLIVGWLALEELVLSGPEVTVEFSNAAGVEPGTTQVQYQGTKVGELSSVSLRRDLKRVRMTLQMNAEMAGHLGPGTQFWIENAKPSLADPASFKSVIAGPSIGMLPKPGETQKLYQGFDARPQVSDFSAGRQFVLYSDKLHHLSNSSPVYYSGLKIGSVESTAFQPDRRFKVTIFIDAQYAGLVHAETRFWDADAVQLAMQPSGPTLQLQSVAALAEGAVDMDTPPAFIDSPPAPDEQQFKLFDGKDAALYAPSKQAVAYQVVFPATAGGLDVGAAVKLAEQRVGIVTASTLEYDAASGLLRTRAVIDLDPQHITLAGEHWAQQPKRQMDDFIAKLISQGLRARIASSVPLVGPRDVEFAFVPGAQLASLQATDPPEIPTTGSGSGIDSIMTAANTVATRLAALTSSPELDQSMDNLNKSLAHVEQLTANAQSQVPALVTELRRVASQTDSTVAQARALLNNQSGVTPTGADTAGLAQSLYELSQAARSIRQLADTLNRNPGALIHGKS
jgi:paraquat-inducible protein B